MKQVKGVLIDISLNYLCCSTLPLLNGDIKLIYDKTINEINEKGDRYIWLINILIDIKNMILDQYLKYFSELSILDKRKNRQLIKEYKRMINLYKYRIDFINSYFRGENYGKIL